MRWNEWHSPYHRPSIDPPGYTISRSGPRENILYQAWAPREQWNTPNLIAGRCRTEEEAMAQCEQHAGRQTSQTGPSA